MADNGSDDEAVEPNHSRRRIIRSLLPSVTGLLIAAVAIGINVASSSTPKWVVVLSTLIMLVITGIITWVSYRDRRRER